MIALLRHPLPGRWDPASFFPGSRLLWACAASAALLLAANAFAGTPSAAFNLPQLIRQAQLGNKDLQAARYAIDIGRARLVQAGLRPNPTLDLSGRSDFLFNNEGEYDIAIAISQEFPIAGRILRQKDVARVDIALAEMEVAEAERKLADDIAGKVYRLLVSERKEGSLDAILVAEEKLLKTSRARFRAAEVSELDVNTVQLDLRRLAMERALLDNEQKALTVAINTLLGRDASAALTVVEPLRESNPLPGLAQIEQKALHQRPDLKAALLGVDRAAAEKALARSLRWQDWSVGLELAQDKQSILGAPEQGVDRTIGVSVSIPLPLFNKGQGLIAEADANRDQSLARVEALRASILGEVAGAHAEANRLQAALAQFGEGSSAISGRNIRLAQQGYDMGLVPVFEVVQAQRQQSELDKAYVETLDQFLQALVRLNTAAGNYTAHSPDASTQP